MDRECEQENLKGDNVKEAMRDRRRKGERTRGIATERKDIKK